MTGAMCAAGIFRVTHYHEYDNVSDCLAHMPQVDEDDAAGVDAAKDVEAAKDIEMSTVMTTVDAEPAQSGDGSRVSVTVEPSK